MIRTGVAWTSGGSGISVGALPAVDTDAAALYDAATELSNAAHSLETAAEGAQDAWKGLPAVYSATGSSSLYAAYGPVATQADGIKGALDRAAGALTDFALAVPGLKNERESLVQRIGAANERLWDSQDEPDSVEYLMAAGRMEQLRLDVQAFAASVQVAEEACEDALRAISGGTPQGLPYGVLAPMGSYRTAFTDAVTTGTAEQMQALALMPLAEAQAWLDAHPQFGDTLADNPPPIDEVVAWWSTLSARPDGQELMAAIITAIPQGLGNLNGVPYWARSEANILVLDAEIEARAQALANADGTQGGFGPALRYAQANDALKDLLAIAESLGADWVHDNMSPQEVLAAIQGPGGYDLTRHQLVELHTDGDRPLAAVSSGDVDKADYLSMIVPGMNTTVESGLPGMVADGDRLVSVQQLALEARGEDSSTAVISWVGYTAPNLVTVFGNGHALEGAEQLATSLEGLDGTLTTGGPNGDGPYTSVLMHSYGGTTGTWTLSQGDYDIDNAVMLNSPGVIIDEASDLYADNVYAATPPDDFVVEVGNLQNTHPHLPREEEFGATWYQVPDTPGNSIDAHGLENHFLDTEQQPYGSSDAGPGQALQQLVTITLGDGENVVLEDPETWQEQHDSYIPQMPTGPGYY